MFSTKLGIPEFKPKHFPWKGSMDITWNKKIYCFLQESYGARIDKSETADDTLISPAAKKMKSDDKQGENDGSIYNQSFDQFKLCYAFLDLSAYTVNQTALFQKIS